MPLSQSSLGVSPVAVLAPGGVLNGITLTKSGLRKRSSNSLTLWRSAFAGGEMLLRLALVVHQQCGYLGPFYHGLGTEDDPIVLE